MSGETAVATDRRTILAQSGHQADIGLAVRLERERQGLTTTELAKRVGISQAQQSRLECGKQGFRSSTLDKIARALGVILEVPYEA